MIDENSKDDLDTLVDHDLGSAMVGLVLVADHHDGTQVGLHCCGPLTPALLSLFPTLPMAPALILVSCCYHRMDPASFPLSQTLTSLDHLLPPPSRAPFLLRLAANEGVERWFGQGEEEHAKHMVEVGRRAVLEVVAEKSGLSLGRRKGGSTISERWGVSEEVEQEVEREVKELGEKLHLIEMMTGLQFLLQRVIEELVAMDRVCYLYERGIKNATLVRIFDGSISPRNIAICASKPKHMKQPH